MKKIARIFLTVFVVSSLLFYNGSVGYAQTVKEKTSETCTTIIVGKGLTEKGNIIEAHNEDLWFDTAQNLKIEPARTVKPTALEKFFYTSQPYGVSSTLAFMGSFNFNDTDVPGDLGLGINEKGVMITTNTAHARPEEIVEQDAPFVYSDFMRYALERATTAKEGVLLVAKALEKHGMSGDPGMMFFVTDPGEAWVLECTPRHWVAEKCPDDGYIGRANQYGITGAGELRSATLISDAIEAKWYTPEDPANPAQGFNFKEVYGDPRWNHGDYLGYNKNREDFIKDFMSKKLSEKGKVSAQDMMALLRSHFEGTDYEAVPPHVRSNTVDYTGNTQKRTICTARTVISLIAEQDSRLPGGLATKLWTAFPAPCTTGYFPIYLSHIQSVFPTSYTNARADGRPTPDTNAWWAYAQLVSSVDKDYYNRALVVRKAYNLFESTEYSDVIALEAKARDLYAQSKTADANALLNNYTDDKAVTAFKMAKSLYSQIEKMKIAGIN